VIIQAIAPVIAGKIFHKRIYYVVLRTLNEELEAKVVPSDEETIHEVLLAYAEILSGTPKQDYVQTNDEIEKFYDACLAQNRPSLYVDLMNVYCAHQMTTIDDEAADIYLSRILRYMNSTDKVLV